MKDNKGKQTSIPVICINANNKPNEIPISQWLVKDKQYTIKEFCIHNLQNRVIGVKLWELNIDNCFPYSSFALTRFGIPTEQLWIEAQEQIDKLLEEAFKNEPILI